MPSIEALHPCQIAQQRAPQLMTRCTTHSCRVPDSSFDGMAHCHLDQHVIKTSLGLLAGDA